MTKIRQKIKKRATEIYLIIIILFGLALGLVLFSGPYAFYDDNHYLLLADQMLNGQFGKYAIQNNVFSYSYMFIGTVAFSFKLLGVSILSVILPSIFEYLLLIVLTFITARQALTKETGLLASLFCATTPFVVAYITRVLPDTLLAIFSTLSIYLTLKAASMKATKERGLVYLSAGIAAGLAIYAKLEGLIFVLMLVVVLLIDSKTSNYLLLRSSKEKGKKILNPNLGRFIAGLSLSISAYLLFFLVFTGNPLFPFEKYGGFLVPGGPLANILQTLFQSLNPDTFHMGDLMSAGYMYPFGLIIFLTMLGSVIAVFRKNVNMEYLSIINWGVLFYLFFGSSSIFSYRPFVIIPRFFTIVIAPMSILSAYAILETYRFLKRRRGKESAVIAVVIMLVSTIVLNLPIYRLLYQYNTGLYNTTTFYSKTLNFIGHTSNPNLTLYVSDLYNTSGPPSPLSIAFLQFLSKYSQSITVYGLDKKCSASKSNVFLLIQSNPTFSTGIKEPIDSWLKGGGCDAVFLTNFTAPYLLGQVYRLEQNTSSRSS